MGTDSVVLAMKATFDPRKADGLDATYGLLFGDDAFEMKVSRGELSARRGEADRPDAVIRSDPDTFASLVFGENRLGKAVEAGDVEIDGSKRAVSALLRALT
jgi:alkyl sulfatase BDS1-like metallo-beta-lactamase superfamily hydrolase